MFGQKPYMSRVEAKGPIKMLEVDRDNYLKWLDCDRNFNRYILQILHRRLRNIWMFLMRGMVKVSWR